jgi:phosphomethylpyrimidine synthase
LEPEPGHTGGGKRRALCLSLASRSAHRRLETLGELTKIAWKHDVQVMIEGPGHVPMHLWEDQFNLSLDPERARAFHD